MTSARNPRQLNYRLFLSAPCDVTIFTRNYSENNVFFSADIVAHCTAMRTSRLLSMAFFLTALSRSFFFLIRPSSIRTNSLARNINSLICAYTLCVYNIIIENDQAHLYNKHSGDDVAVWVGFFIPLQDKAANKLHYSSNCMDFWLNNSKMAGFMHKTDEHLWLFV